MLGLRGWLVRPVCRLLIAVLSVTSLGSLLHGAHDIDYLQIGPHDESQHHYQAAPSDPLPGTEHCLACHFARSSRGPVAWELTGFHAFTAGQRLFHDDGQVLAVLLASPTPARAPPLA
jgi:hypothetical protein